MPAVRRNRAKYLGRKDSSFEQFNGRVPADVRERLKGEKVTIVLPASGLDPERVITFTLGTFSKVSLHTRDRNSGDVRRAVVRAELAKIYDAARREPMRLSQRQRVALSHDAYRMIVDTYRDEPGTPEMWEGWKALTRAALEGRISGAPAIPIHAQSDDRAAAALLFGPNLTEGVNAMASVPAWEAVALQQRCGMIALYVLRRRGIEIASNQQLDLLKEVARAALDAGWYCKRMAGGDYRPDPVAERFPVFEETPTRAMEAVSFESAVNHWMEHEKGRPSSGANRKVALQSLAKKLGHDDMMRVTGDDVMRWRSDLMNGGKLAPGTIKTRLADVRATFSYAAKRKLIPASPFDGIDIGFKAERVGTVEARRPYSPDQVARLLSICERETKAYRRWIPLLAATTGARVAEIAQVWGNRVRQVDGVWLIEIRAADDGGSLKTAESRRDVPLHPKVIEAGFLHFVRSVGEGPLFYRRRPGKPSANSTHPSRFIGQMLGKWIRAQGFTDTSQDPNHAFRHYWKTQAHRHGVDIPTADYLTGHKSPGMGAHYRHVAEDRAALAAAIAKVPVPTLPAQVQAMPAMPT